ncbi:putative receptor protein kinase TMK1-like, partial [Trifolium medium]|nr:putative receptor protein kinase TMK1-like [Trifolium medium]
MKPEEISGMGASKFEAEMAVLKRASHSNLVLLLGYCLDGDEMLIVYENMGEGTLSRYLFYWKDNGLEPLMWNRRLSIALD